MSHQPVRMIMGDGSRFFGDFPETCWWEDVRDWVTTIPGAVLTGYVTDHVLEAWIDFTYRGHQFSINNQYESYWFFVDDPDCPDEILASVLDLWAPLFERT